ncbi:MAG: hypothetical protein ACE5Q6_09400 [Dehalococcoidia bacterium]
MYTVTRQLQWPDGLEVVEVSEGDINYVNPDMLGPKYPGEGETYANPKDAAAAAIEICRKWRQDGHQRARVAYGATLGMTMPFSPCTFQELRQWAEWRYQQLVDSLPGCDSCGETIWDPDNCWYVPELYGEKFCSQKCAEEAYESAVTPDPDP